MTFHTPTRDVSAVRLNNSNAVDLGFESRNSVRVYVHLQENLPAFGIRTIQQPGNLVQSISGVLITLLACNDATVAGAAPNNSSNCSPTAPGSVFKPVVNQNAVYFDLKNIQPNRIFSFGLVVLGAGNVQLSPWTWPVVNPVTGEHEFITSSASGLITIVNDATMIEGNPASVPVVAGANNRLDLRVKLYDAEEGGAVLANAVAIEEGALPVAGTEILQ